MIIPGKKIHHKCQAVAGFLVFLLTSVVFCGSALALAVPAYKGYVNDYGGMISPQMENRLEQLLGSFDRSDSTQVAVLTIPSLEGDALEDFSIRVTDQWKIGRKGKDNGVLLLVAKQERKVRIEVGRGLEPVLTDLLAGRIIDSVITPYFKAGRFDQGFEAGITAIVQAGRGEFKADRRYGRSRRGEEPSPLFKFLFFGIVLVAFIGSNSRKAGAIAGGFLFPVAFLLGLIPSLGFFFLLLLIFAGTFGGWLLPLIVSSFFLGGGMGGFGGGYYGRGMRGGHGGGFSGGGFGGFGGGGFGGGGASGGW
jgi:uncharacterized protein